MNGRNLIAAIIMCGAIVFGAAGDIKPASAAVSTPDPAPESSSSQDLKSESSSRAPASSESASSEEEAESSGSSEPAPVVKPVVMTKEEIKQAVHTMPTEEEKKEDPQRNETKPVEQAPVIELPPAEPEVSSQTSADQPGAGFAAGWHTISGKRYYSNGNSFLTGWNVIGGRRYYFGESGEQLSLTGIDVSVWQGAIDWQKVKADGIDYVMIRIGWRGNGITSDEHPDYGKMYPDTNFEANYRGAKNAGLKVGVYFFSQSINEQEAADEAAFVIEALKGHPIDMPVAYDIEGASGSDKRVNAAGITNQMRTDMSRVFCEAIRAAGYTPQVYTYVNYAYGKMDMTQLSAYQTWIAHTGVPDNSITSYRYPYVAWQYAVAGAGAVKGITTAIDMNVMVSTGIHHTLNPSSPGSSSQAASSSASSSPDSSSGGSSGGASSSSEPGSSSGQSDSSASYSSDAGARTSSDEAQTSLSVPSQT